MNCISIVDWVQILTQITLALTAVIMAFLAYQTYLKTPTQEDNNYKTEIVSKSAEHEIIVFETSKQRTRLSIRSGRLECYLLDKKTKTENLQWIINKEQAGEILENSNIYVNPSYKPRTGTFSIGHKRNWLYSKNLYPEPDYLKGELKSILKQIFKQNNPQNNT